MSRKNALKILSKESEKFSNAVRVAESIPSDTLLVMTVETYSHNPHKKVQEKILAKTTNIFNSQSIRVQVYAGSNNYPLKITELVSIKYWHIKNFIPASVKDLPLFMSCIQKSEAYKEAIEYRSLNPLNI